MSSILDTAHEEWLKDLEKLDMTCIREAAGALCDLYYGIWDKSPSDINTGSCEDFAHELIRILGLNQEEDDVDALWHDEMEDCNPREQFYWGHKFVRYEGKFYDSEAPHGVAAWRELPFFASRPCPSLKEACTPDSMGGFG